MEQGKREIESESQVGLGFGFKCADR